MTDTNEATTPIPIPETQRRALASVGRAILDGQTVTDEMLRALPARFVNPIKALAIGSFGPVHVPLTRTGRAYALAAAADWFYQYSDDSRVYNAGLREVNLAVSATSQAGLRLKDVLRDLGVRR